MIVEISLELCLGCRIFVATWNVGGKTPNNSINLEEFLQVEDTTDIYVIGFVTFE